MIIDSHTFRFLKQNFVINRIESLANIQKYCNEVCLELGASKPLWINCKVASDVEWPTSCNRLNDWVDHKNENIYIYMCVFQISHLCILFSLPYQHWHNPCCSGVSLELWSSAVVPYNRTLFRNKLLYAGNIFLDSYKITRTYNLAP